VVALFESVGSVTFSVGAVSFPILGSSDDVDEGLGVGSS
jgi:hypothetical protein